MPTPWPRRSGAGTARVGPARARGQAHPRPFPQPCWRAASKALRGPSTRSGAASAGPPSSPRRPWSSWRCGAAPPTSPPPPSTPWRRAGSTTTWAAVSPATRSTDRWLVPHFEKMLYDNALLMRLYTHGWQVTGADRYRQVVEETAAYLLRHPDAVGGGRHPLGRGRRQRGGRGQVLRLVAGGGHRPRGCRGRRLVRGHGRGQLGGEKYPVAARARRSAPPP